MKSYAVTFERTKVVAVILRFGAVIAQTFRDEKWPNRFSQPDACPPPLAAATAMAARRSHHVAAA